MFPTWFCLLLFCACVASQCTDETFECFPGFCIPEFWVCDGTPDCMNGNDEKNCDKSQCKNNQFDCGLGICIHNTKKCDGIKDCLSGSDEEGCSEGTECKDYESKCKNGECILSKWFCDGEKDCTDASDEDNCDTMTTTDVPAATNAPTTTVIPTTTPVLNTTSEIQRSVENYTTVICPEPAYQCTSGECIPKHWKCDGRIFCQDASDETDCHLWTCNNEEFRCDMGRCILKAWLCDGQIDCPDGEDEDNCTTSTGTTQIEPTLTETLPDSTQEEGQDGMCPPSSFQCSTGECIPRHWVCDGRVYCEDGSDEVNCQSATCKDIEYQCTSGRCIISQWVCDGQSDCPNGEDEEACDGVTKENTEVSTEFPNTTNSQSTNATKQPDITTQMPDTSSTTEPVNCRENEFQCADGICISDAWVCDQDVDCDDAEDEVNCTNVTCKEYEYKCANGLCISNLWKCDGQYDCIGGDDENDCNIATCKDDEYRCASGVCISQYWKCDGQADCIDGDDEHGCDTDVTTAYPIQPTEVAEGSGSDTSFYDSTTQSIEGSGDDHSVNESCPERHYKCKNGMCISEALKCDGRYDCEEEDDEQNCETEPTPTSTSPPTITENPNAGRCGDEEFECNSTTCIPFSWKCDGDRDCFDGSDELQCSFNNTCEPDSFQCNSYECIPIEWMCDSENDCPDNEDERNCTDSTERPPDHTTLMTTHPQGNCDVDEYQCLSGLCILWSWKCDGQNDCTDGDDELNCHLPVNRKCPSLTFMCKSGECLPETWVCDGEADCPEEEDEMKCGTSTMTPTSTVATHTESTTKVNPNFLDFDDMGEPKSDADTNPTQPSLVTTPATPVEDSQLFDCERSIFSCKISNCIPLDQVCDGSKDCPDGSDEVNCPEKSNGTCSQGMKYCVADDKCISDTLFCNRKVDCSDLSDEIDCETRDCTYSEFRCTVTGQCIYKEWLCDGHADCPDKSDEENCTEGRTSNGFSCEDGTFVENSMRCDGLIDCYNGLDEVHCPDTVTDEPPTGAPPPEYTCITLAEYSGFHPIKCPGGFDSFGSYCLHINAFPRTWSEASEICSNMSSRLVEFTYQCIGEYYIAQYLQEEGIDGWNYWIGQPFGTSETRHFLSGYMKTVEIPEWYLKGKTCIDSPLEVNAGSCYFIDHEESRIRRALNCDDYAGYICELLPY